MGKDKFSDDFAKPSEAPSSGESFKLESEENVGKLFLISPLREQDFTSDLYGTSQIIVADVVELDEKKPEKSVEHTEVYIFGGWTKGALRGYVGTRRVLARLAQDQSKSKSKNPAWVLEDADADDVQVARDYLASVDPFAQKGAKGDADEKPAKKAKKKK